MAASPASSPMKNAVGGAGRTSPVALHLTKRKPIEER